MTLRAKIEKFIQAANGDVAQAAINVCLLLEDTIGLAGNGWFDDDAEILAIFVDQHLDLPDCGDHRLARE